MRPCVGSAQGGSSPGSGHHKRSRAGLWSLLSAYLWQAVELWGFQPLDTPVVVMLASAMHGIECMHDGHFTQLVCVISIPLVGFC